MTCQDLRRAYTRDIGTRCYETSLSLDDTTYKQRDRLYLGTMD